MLSSAGVTRPSWSDDKKTKMAGAADIPIVRLNPGGILGLKCDAEQVWVCVHMIGVFNLSSDFCVKEVAGLLFFWPCFHLLHVHGWSCMNAHGCGHAMMKLTSFFFNFLSSQALRDSDLPYCIVRPCGLNEDWAPGRPVLSQVRL
jgi:hypothetical protein